MKVSAFIKDLVSRYIDIVQSETYGQWQLRLYNASTAFSYSKLWADMTGLECSFKGYSPISLTSLGYGLPTEPATGKWQAKTPPHEFAYNSGLSGLSSEDAYGWMLVTNESGTIKLREYEDLPSPKTFAADGDVLTLYHKFIELNCEE